MKNIFISLVLLVVLISCNTKPEFIGINNISIEGLKDTVMLVKMDYIVYNPNNVKTKLRQSSMDLFYRDTLVGKGYLDEQITLSPNDTIKVPVRCEVSLAKLSRFYPYLLQSDSTVFTIRGESKIGFLLNSFTIDIDDKIYLNTKKIIKEEINKNLGVSENFKIKTILVNKLPTLSQTNFNIKIEAKNNLSFDYQIEDMQLQFYIDTKDTPIAKWKLEYPIKQKAHNTTQISIDVMVDNFNTLKQTKLSWFIKRKADFIIIGKAQIKIKEYTFTVPINDKMAMDIKTLTGF